MKYTTDWVIQQLLDKCEVMGEEWSMHAHHAVMKHCCPKEKVKEIMDLFDVTNLSLWVKTGAQIVDACKQVIQWYKDNTNWTEELEKFLNSGDTEWHNSLVLTYKGCGEKYATWHLPKPCDGMIIWYTIEKGYDYYGTLSYIKVNFDSAYPISKVSELSYSRITQLPLTGEQKNG